MSRVGPPGPGALRAGASALIVVLRGDGFLRHMVRDHRRHAGRDRPRPLAAARMGELLASRDRRRAGPTAPPQGLFLVEVEY